MTVDTTPDSTAVPVRCEKCSWPTGATRYYAGSDGPFCLQCYRDTVGEDSASLAADRGAWRALAADRDAWRTRAERAEAALRTRIDAEYRSAYAADYAARARLAAERAGIPPTERDRRGVDLGVGAGVGGSEL